MIINFNECIEHKTIVAFKPKNIDEWYTGRFDYLSEPNTKYNNDEHWKFSIKVILPINPQWIEDDDKITYYYDEIENIILID